MVLQSPATQPLRDKRPLTQELENPQQLKLFTEKLPSQQQANWIEPQTWTSGGFRGHRLGVRPHDYGVMTTSV